MRFINGMEYKGQFINDQIDGNGTIDDKEGRHF